MTEPDRILAVPCGPDVSPRTLARLAVELPSGQAAVTVPIEAPPGRNGMAPDLKLTYGSVSGPGPFGVGWTLPLLGVRRVGERYWLERPEGGGGELVALGGGRFRPRTDERFSRIELAENKWRLRDRDGRVHELGPVAEAPTRWVLLKTSDTFGHRIEYRWQGDRLVEVRWLDHGRGPQAGMLASIALDYEGSRCARIRVLSHAGPPAPIRTYHLEHDQAQNGWLLLRRVRIEAHDGSRSESPGTVELGYTPFDPSRRRFVALTAADRAALQPVEHPSLEGRERPPADFPRIPLDDRRVHRVDLSGDGRPDAVIVRDESIVYWPKLAEGGWGAAVRMEGAPALPDFRPERVFLADVDGDGLADLIYVGDGDVRLYINRSGRGWSLGAHIHGTPSPADVEVGMVALPGGSAGVLWSSARGAWLLDLTGGARPYLLSSVRDPLGGPAGGVELSWAPISIGLPRPVQVVTQVRRGSHTASYVYETPILRGGFRGFSRVDKREDGVETRTWFGSEGKSVGRRIKSETRRADGNVETREWSWGTPATDGVYGVVATGERDGARHRFFWDHDAFGQPRAELSLHAPDDGAHSWSGELTLRQYAGREEPSLYLVDRPARITRYCIDTSVDPDVESLKRAVVAGERRAQLVGDTIHQYDGQPFVGLAVGQVGKHGLRVRTEQLAFTEEWLHTSLREVPAWLKATRPEWSDEYPKGFRGALPPLGGYLRRPVTVGGHEVDGWWVVSERRRYDFQEAGATPRGRVTVLRDALEHDTTVQYDSWELLPVKVSDARGLATQAAWDYRVTRPKSVVTVSGGRTAFHYSAVGQVERASFYARPADEKPLRETSYSYDSSARMVRTRVRDGQGERLERVDWFDAAGRTLETRTAAAEVAFAPLPALGTAEDAVGKKAERVIVTQPGRAPRDAVGWERDEIVGGPEAVVRSVEPDGPRDLLGRRWGTARRSVALDAAGGAVEERDSLGALLLRAFDAGGREVRRWARDRASDSPTLRVWRIYGDSIESGLPVQRAAEANLLGRLHRQFDEAGLVSYQAYDADGNPLDRTRQPLTQEAVAAGAVDWQPHGSLSLDAHARELLDDRRHRTDLRWDARGRLTGVTFPADVAGRRREMIIERDRAGRPMRLQLDGRALVDHVAWDAAGRRLLVAWGNGLLQRWARDEGGRAIRLRTESFETAGEHALRCTGRMLQEYWCERDAAGRITQIIDDSPDAGVAHRSHRLERNFSWDDDGRLVAASGRESGRAPDWPWEDSARPVETSHMRAYNDGFEWREGRLRKQTHDAGRGSFSREWQLDDDGRLTRLSGSDGYLSYQLDGEGRLALESSVRRFVWDHAGRLARYRWGEDPPQIDLIDRYTGGTAERALRLLRRADGPTEMIVRDGEFVHERGDPGGDRNWLHLSVGDWRIASVRSGPQREGEAEAPLRFHLEDLDGSIGLVADDAGQELAREGYSSLGETSWGGSSGQLFRYQGAERDSHTGLYVIDGRPYAPWLGRFVDDGTTLPALQPPAHVAVQQNLTTAPPDSGVDEIFRTSTPAIVDNRGTEHGERQLPNPGPRHRPEPQGGAWPARGGMGQREGLR
jgi:RHS repeat-associated protein